MMSIPKYVSDVLNRLEENGFSAYVVGGCVRDYLLGRPINDFDVATSALPEEMLEIFKDYKTVDNGIKHGTVAVVSENKLVEVTTFRSDGTYTDSRRPDSVSFERNIEEDLARRDFTINAMAYRKSEGIIDLYGGQEDLKNRLIRCVGNPQKLFSELQILLVHFLLDLSFLLHKAQNILQRNLMFFHTSYFHLSSSQVSA